MSRVRVCGLLLSAAMAGLAGASPQVGVTHINGYFAGMGGEFTVTPNPEFAAWTGELAPFGSFCMELSENVDMDAMYDAVISCEAMQGGYNNGPAGPGGGDPLDPRTAFLYSRFRAGKLTGYNYTPGEGRALSAQALQDVIWYLEDEMSMTWSVGSLQDIFCTAAQNAVDLGIWTGLGNVRVMSLYAPGHAGDAQYRNQDMLVTVPAPAAIVLGVLGTGLTGWLRKRRML